MLLGVPNYNISHVSKLPKKQKNVQNKLYSFNTSYDNDDDDNLFHTIRLYVHDIRRRCMFEENVLMGT